MLNKFQLWIVFWMFQIFKFQISTLEWLVVWVFPKNQGSSRIKKTVDGSRVIMKKTGGSNRLISHQYTQAWHKKNHLSNEEKNMDHTWRIIPVSKWLITMVSKFSM